MTLGENKKTLNRIQQSDIDANGHFKVPDGIILIRHCAAIEVKELLKSIDLNEVTTIGDMAFDGCVNLERVEGTPSAVGFRSFNDCEKLTSFDFSNVSKIDISAFSRCGFVEVFLPAAKQIPAKCFGDCKNLEKVVGSPVHIGPNAFSKCEKLTEFDFSNTTSIEGSAFFESGLKEAVIPTVKNITTGAFARCGNLEKVVCTPKLVDDSAFLGCTKLTDFDFSGVEVIYANSFKDSGLRNAVTENDEVVRISHNGYEATFAKTHNRSCAKRVVV